MNKLLQKVAKIFLGLSMAAGVGVAIGAGRKDASPAQATDLTINFSSFGFSGSNSEKTESTSGYSFCATSGNSSSGLAKSSHLYNKTALPGNITGVSISGASFSSSSNATATFYAASASNGTTSSLGTFTANGDYSYTASGSYRYLTLVVGSGRTLKFTSITVSYSGGTTYTVTYNNNGGSGTMTDSNSPYSSGATVTVKECSFTAPSGKEFSKWNTAANGQGTDYVPGATFGISANTILYAQWVAETGTKLTFPLTSNPGNWPTTSSSTLTDYTYTLSDVNYTFKLKNVKCNSGYLMLNYVAVLGLPAIQGKKLTKVVATNSSGCSQSTSVGISSSSSSATYIAGGSTKVWSTRSTDYTYTLTSTSANTVYYLYVTAANAQITNLVLTYQDVVTYTATFEVDSNCTGYGTLSSSSIEYINPGTSISVSGNKVTIGNSSVTATATSQTTQYSYAFSSWSVSNGDTVNSNITITATFARTTRSYDVTFNMQGHGEAPTKQTIAYGGAVTQPSPAPEVTGYTFGGWYKESSCSNAWNFNTDTVAGTTVLYAKWTVNNYQVSFYLNDHGTSATPATQTVSYGGTVTEPSAPTDTQYNFVGWYKEPECENAWDFNNDTVSGTTVLYASWTIKTFTISLVSGSHGSLSGTTTVNYGTTFSVTLVADHGYGLPQSLTGVTMDGSGDILSQVTYSAGSITGPAVTGDVVINASCVLLAKTYNISTTVSNGGTSGGDTSIEDMGGEATVTVAAGSGYKLPDSISVTGASFTYTKSDKYHASISLSNVSLNDPLEEQVEITVTCVQLTSYNISFTNVQHASHSGAETITEDGEATIVITPDSGYYSPESSSVTVTNATKVSWTKATNTLVIRDPEGAVSISYTPDVNTLTGITLSASSGNYELGDPIEMPTVTAHYSHISDQVITEGNYSVSGTYNPYLVGDYVLTISYTYAGDTESETYTAHVTAASVETVTTWELTSLGALTSSDTFVIVGNKSSTNYAMSNNNGTGSAPSAVEVTVENNKITSSVADTIKWNISGNSTDGYVFYPNGETETWLYAINNNNCLRVGDSENNTFEIKDDYLYNKGQGRYIGVYNSQDWRGYTTIHDNIANETFAFYKEVKTQTGSADLIRITAEYTGGVKYVGNTVSVSDFLIKKQYNTGDTLTTLTSEEMATVTIVSGATLTGEDNTVVLRYVEGGIPQTASVSVSAIEVTAELQSVTLVQDSQTVKKNYVFVSGLQWDFTGLSVAIDYDDDDFDLSFDLATLVQNGEATISPAAPSVGDTSFTVSYRYNDEMDISSATVSGIIVREDYVTSMSWTGTTASHFKAFSGGQLTAAQVGAWHVIPTFAGAGVGSELSFNQYTLKVGSKVISSLPYTWTSEDDGQELSITYGKDVDGEDFVKTNNTAVANVCATINAIDHDTTVTPAWDEDIEGYYLVTKVSDLSAGDNVVIVASDYNYAMSTTQNNNNRGATSVTKDGDSVSWTGSDVQTFTLEAGTTAGTFAFNTGNGYIYAASSGSNYLRTETTKSGNSSFEISIDDGVATMEAQGNNTHNLIQYNNGSTIFACYSNAQKDVSIYKYVSDTIHHDAVVETTHYANQMEHFDAQKAVVAFAKFMNTTMNGADVCSGTQANLSTAWTSVAAKYSELITNNKDLSSTEKDWANNMLKYANASWASSEEAACVEKAMQTYEFCVTHHSDVCNAFLSGVRTVSAPHISPLINIVGEKANSVAIIVIISMVSVTAIGGYFFIRKRKED